MWIYGSTLFNYNILLFYLQCSHLLHLDAIPIHNRIALVIMVTLYLFTDLLSSCDRLPCWHSTQLSRDHMISLCGHVIPSLAHMIPSLAHMIPSLAHMIPSPGHVIPFLEHVTLLFDHVTLLFDHVIPSLGHVTWDTVLGLLYSCLLHCCNLHNKIIVTHSQLLTPLPTNSQSLQVGSPTTAEN